jgi:hypothetical protein
MASFNSQARVTSDTNVVHYTSQFEQLSEPTGSDCRRLSNEMIPTRTTHEGTR